MVVKTLKNPPDSNCAKSPDSNCAKVSQLQSKFRNSPGRHKIVDLGTGKNRLHIEAFQGGFLIGYFDNGTNTGSAAYNKPHLVKLSNDDELRENVRVDDIVYRRGIDGETAMPGKTGVAWGWQALISYIGPDNINNTTFKMVEFVTPIIVYFNQFDDFKTDYTYKRPTKFYMDHTPITGPLRKLSSVLLDDKVLDLMIYDYKDEVTGQIDLAALAEVDEIVEVYWEDIEYGKNVMKLAHLTK